MINAEKNTGNAVYVSFDGRGPDINPVDRAFTPGSLLTVQTFRNIKYLSESALNQNWSRQTWETISFAVSIETFECSLQITVQNCPGDLRFIPCNRGSVCPKTPGRDYRRFLGPKISSIRWKAPDIIHVIIFYVHNVTRPLQQYRIHPPVDHLNF